VFTARAICDTKRANGHGSRCGQDGIVNGSLSIGSFCVRIPVTSTSLPALCVVLHGKAAGRDDVRTAVASTRDQGFAIDVRVTWEPGDTTRFTREAVDAGFSVVVAGGGDGTVNEVVRGLIDAGGAADAAPSLAIVPLGTANDLAHACGVPLDPLAALQLAVTGPTAMVDVGQVNDRCFLNVATGGFGAQVTVATPNSLKQILGAAAYLVTGLNRFTSIRSAHARVTAPGLNWDGEFLLLAVGNGRQAGGGHRLCPEAMINDGLFELRLLPHLQGEEIAEVMRAILREGVAAVKRTVVSAQVPWLEIEAAETLQINLDGEPIEDRRFRFDVLPRRLKMKLPTGCPLLS
jgi:lipid kinase YegS